MKNWDARGRFVVAQLQATANRSQAGIRALLKGRGKHHQPSWIANTVKVTLDRSTLDELAARPEVEAIVPDVPIPLPAPQPAQAEATINLVEWGIDRIGAPLV